ncbi:hypothetical protein F975_02348 [Acinetobacter sp. ANC 3789]|uniref:hypothetical protein n=1 Tax=Acinetobacter sp. ANC 3789 TaxID=1217714 RepID=UPI0002CFA82E|nr:hypothetical protein [Acinetobacter sp. ANC 3789]ENU79719.1 hypothetical protein F975_02348 [Acinetobacter sp. ANC 3789]
MNKALILASMISLLVGCSELNYTKLSMQAKECIADNSVSCNDIRIRHAIAGLQLFRDRITAEPDKAKQEVGEAGYQELLQLVDHKIEYLEQQRPSFYLRWFQSDARYDKEVDFGESIDVAIERIINSQTPAKATPATTPSPIIQDGETVQTASASSEPAYRPASADYKHEYSFLITGRTAEIDYKEVITTNQGTVSFDMHSTSVAQNWLLDNLSVGECIRFRAQYPAKAQGQHHLAFETYISDPEPISCNSMH